MLSVVYNGYNKRARGIKLVTLLSLLRLLISLINNMKLTKLPSCVKFPYPTSPFVAQLVLDASLQVLNWSEVKSLHETARELCPERFKLVWPCRYSA